MNPLKQLKPQTLTYNIKQLRLGDCINYPHKGEIVGIHYILRDESEKIIQSTYQWGKVFQWKIGSPSIVQQVDDAIRKVSLGGKALITIERKQLSKENERLTYQVQLIYIK